MKVIEQVGQQDHHELRGKIKEPYNEGRKETKQETKAIWEENM